MGSPPRTISDPHLASQAPMAPAIRSYLQEHAGALLKLASLFINSARLARGPEAVELSHELFQDLAKEALSSAEKLTPDRDMNLWLKGIMGNLVKRRRDKLIKESQRTYQRRGDAQSDAEFFDRIAHQTQLSLAAEPEAPLSDRRALEQAMEQLEPMAREAILAVRLGLTSEEAGARWGVPPATARQRMYRALNQVRELLLKGGAR